VQRIINNSSLVQKLLGLWEGDSVDVKKEICWIFSNITNSGNPAEVFNFYQNYEIIKFYINMLSSEDDKAV
jgi:hypothetical protein